jgi:hypothetical protein
MSQEDDDRDKEAERILAMTDEEIIREYAAQGEDLELLDMRVRAIIERAIEDSKLP